MSKAKSVDVYVLAGPDNSGKTTTIRRIINKACNLDEEYKSNQRVVEIEITIDINIKVKIKILCKTGSVQEAKKDSTYLTMLKNIVSKKNISAILIPLRTDEVNGLPKADSYINDLKKFGWNIKCVVELDVAKSNVDTDLKEYCDKNQYKYKSFEKPDDYPCNELYEKIKKFFGFNL